MTEQGWPLPAGMAEKFAQFQAGGVTPATPRRAATVALVRPAGDGLEVYVIRRAVSMVFGGVYAFPGGGVDASDTGLPLLRSDWPGRLDMPADDAAAVVAAAVREVFEESGVLFAGAGAGEVVGDVSDDGWEADRQALAARAGSLSELLHRRGLVTRDDLLLPWARWITPEFEPRRFDTYFFVAVLPAGQRTRDVSGEADRTAWVRPADALRRYAAGELRMLPPTVATLRDLAEFRRIDELAGAAAGRDAARPVRPRVESTPDGGLRLLV